MIYFRSSGGAFAILHYSFFDPDSIALVLAPKTSMDGYRAGAWRIYLE